MEDKGLHPVVKLLLARIKSHPDEFNANAYSRWEDALEVIDNHGSEAEKKAINDALYDLYLNQIHESVMDELCNGEERRRRQTEEHTKMSLAQQQYVQQYTNQSAQQKLLGASTPYYTREELVNNPGPFNAVKKALGL